MLDLSMLLDWRMWLMVLLVFLMGGCVATSTSKGNQELGVRFGNEIAFFSRASQTSPEEAWTRTELDVQALLEFLAEQDAKAEVPDEPTP